MKNNSMLHYTLIRLRRNYLALFGLAILILLIVCAVFAEQLAPYGYAAQDYMMMRCFFGPTLATGTAESNA